MVNVKRIVYSQKLDGYHLPTKLEKYLVFGESPEYFAAHLIYDRPSFDFIASTQRPWFTKDHPCPSRLCGQKIKVFFNNEALPQRLSTLKEEPVKMPSKDPLLGDPEIAGSFVQDVLYSEADF